MLCRNFQHFPAINTKVLTSKKICLGPSGHCINLEQRARNCIYREFSARRVYCHAKFTFYESRNFHDPLPAFTLLRAKKTEREHFNEINGLTRLNEVSPPWKGTFRFFKSHSLRIIHNCCINFVPRWKFMQPGKLNRENSVLIDWNKGDNLFKEPIFT